MYKVSEEILAKATKCDRNFDCLNDSKGPSCEINNCSGGEVCFLKKLNRNCNYHISFGFEHVCLCPVRKELYRKYGI